MITAPCPVCGADAALLDVVDLNKSCEEARGRFLPLSGEPVYYALCDACGFCFAPEIARWPREEFAKRIYNDDYHLVDPDFEVARPKHNARSVQQAVGHAALELRHLDYGGGNGQLSAELFAAGWDSQSYDPFVDSALPERAEKYNFITCFEVFEHVPDVNDLVRTLGSLLADPGVVMFTTLTSDEQIARGKRLTWWYASPRNGHISLFSRRSLALIAEKWGFESKSTTPLVHLFWREFPTWASPLLSPS